MTTDDLPRHPSFVIAQPFIDRHRSDFQRVIEAAWQRWREFPAGDRRAIGALEGGMPTVVAAYMKEEAARLFDGRRDEGIIPRDRYDPPAWSFSNRVLVRFKKMDHKGLSRNLLTRRMQLYLHNDPIADEGLWESVRLEVGYNTNEQQTDIAQIWIVHRRDNRVIWRLGLKDGGVLELPFASRDHVDSDAEDSLVRPRVPSHDDKEARVSFVTLDTPGEEPRSDEQPNEATDGKEFA